MREVHTHLQRLPFWGQLTEQQRETVERSAVVRPYSQGDGIHGRGEACLGMLCLLRGSVRIYLLSEEGREVTLYRLHEGDCCVISASCVISQITFEAQMTAETDCEMLIIGSSVFAELAEENIYVRCFMYEQLTERFSSVMWSMQQILFAGVDRRLASYLLREYERTGLRELRMTHEQIAQQISSAREVVARMLKRFAADGLVETRRGAIQLTDLEGLQALA